MARKFGKKTEISLNPLDYSIYLMGEGGIGKTTVIKQVCEKMVGDDGYIFLTCGKEADQRRPAGRCRRTPSGCGRKRSAGRAHA